MGLMTPVIKGVLTDFGFDNAVKAQQMLGGHGYIEEWGLSQFVRDARITMLYEGANAIQAMDLVGRKLPKEGGRAILAYFSEIEAFLKRQEGAETMQPFTAPLARSLEHLRQATLWFLANALKNPDQAGAGAYDFMHLLGRVAIGHAWAQMAEVALRMSTEKNTVRLILARFWMERLMPETAAHLARITAGAETIMALEEEAF
jgi:acyl-CoA dehydrogenase